MRRFLVSLLSENEYKTRSLSSNKRFFFLYNLEILIYTARVTVPYGKRFVWLNPKQVLSMFLFFSVKT